MTNDCVVMVSDRRLTNGLTGELLSDAENKAVVLAGQLVLGYTGLARLDNLPTERWIIEQLAGRPFAEYFQILGQQTARALSVYRRKYRWHAYLSVGWLLDSADQHVPVAVVTSNYIKEDGTMLREPSTRFTSFKVLLPNTEPVVVLSVGVPVQESAKVAIRRAIRRYQRQNPGRPQGIVHILGNALLGIAARDARVGRNVMVISFPRKALPVTEVTMAFHDRSWEDRLIARYVGENSAVMQFAPAMIGPEVAIFGAEVWGERPPWWHDDEPDTSPTSSP
jgi:hypothetical protein